MCKFVPEYHTRLMNYSNRKKFGNNFAFCICGYYLLKQTALNSEFLAKIERTKSAITVHQNDIFFKENTLGGIHILRKHIFGVF